MQKCTMTLVTVSATGDNETKDFGGVNMNYIKSVGVTNGAGTSIAGVDLPAGYDTLWEWVDAVGRAFASLSTNTYHDARIVATFSAGGEYDGE